MNGQIVELRAKRDALVKEAEAVIEDEAAYEAKATELRAVNEKLAKLEQAELEVRQSYDLSAKVDQLRTAVYVAGSENPYHEGSKFDWASDFLRAEVLKDSDAAMRVAAHNQIRKAELRATTSSDLGGTVIPQYESAIDTKIEGRPFLNTLTQRPVRSSVVHIPTVDSGDLDDVMGFQTAENTAFANADYGTTDATYTVKTLGAYTDVSVQAIEFGEVTTSDLLSKIQRSYNRLVDRQALHGTVDNATNLLGIVNTPGVYSVSGAGADTFAEFWALLNDCAAEIEDATFSRASHVVMSRRRWNWLVSQLASDGRPIIGLNHGQPVNTVGSSSYELGGFTVVVDNNVDVNGATPTDNVVVYSPQDVWFYEGNGGSLTTVYVDQTLAHTGTVRVVGRNYVNFPGVKPNPGAAAVIDGLPYPVF